MSPDPTPSTTEPAPGSLADVVREVEQHAASAGWEQPALLFALVDTAQLLEQEPQLAAVLGLDGATPPAPGQITPVEQETIADSLEELLPSILWPEEVAGCAVVVEATTVPPGETGGGTGLGDGLDEVPSDPEQAAAYAAEHPDREEARVVAAVLRTGETWCAIRQRSHDEDDLVMTGPDLVPGLLELLRATLQPEGDQPDQRDEPGAPGEPGAPDPDLTSPTSQQDPSRGGPT